jgi:hypothetical protein
MRRTFQRLFEVSPHDYRARSINPAQLNSKIESAAAHPLNRGRGGFAIGLRKYQFRFMPTGGE